MPFESNNRMLALYCNFPSKLLRQNIIPRTQKNSKPYPNIKLLKTASKVQETFSSGLDNHLSDTIDTTDVDALESIITMAIETVTSETIPSLNEKMKQIHGPMTHIYHSLMNANCVKIRLGVQI